MPQSDRLARPSLYQPDRHYHDRSDDHSLPDRRFKTMPGAIHVSQNPTEGQDSYDGPCEPPVGQLDAPHG